MTPSISLFRRLKFSLVLSYIYGSMVIASITVFHAYFLTPFCNIPCMNQTVFCAAVHATAFCALHGATFLPFCCSSNSATLSFALKDEFKQFMALFQASEDTPILVNDIGEAVHAIDNLIILVCYS